MIFSSVATLLDSILSSDKFSGAAGGREVVILDICFMQDKYKMLFRSLN